MEISNKNILIIFDMDGLIFDTERIGISSWKKAGEKYGFEIESSFCISVLGLNQERIKEIFYQYYDEGIPFDDIIRLRTKYMFEYIEENGIQTKEGFFELIELLERKKIVKAIATSSDRKKVDKYLNLANMMNVFDCIVCGDEIINGKPHPDIFLKVVEKLNWRFNYCYVLEDSENGIKAAYRAKMRPIFIPDICKPSETIEKLIFKEFNSLLDVKDYFDSMQL